MIHTFYDSMNDIEKQTYGRYIFERELFPRYAFEKDPKVFIPLTVVMARAPGPFWVAEFEDRAKAVEALGGRKQIRYEKSDFSGKALHFTKSWANGKIEPPKRGAKIYHMVQVQLPEPERPGLAYRVYFCYDDELKRRAYYLVWKTENGTRAISGIDRKLVEDDYGIELPEVAPVEEELPKIAKIYFEINPPRR
ncbi:MAG: hypothetical protein IJM30_12230 [Thermoguttaceae bacterium]|nr:hypothetical protein [Thermoguttaceae bacterium]